VNIIVPIILDQLTELEKWDFAADRLLNSLWRSYFANIINNVLYIIIQLEIIANISIIDSYSMASFKDGNSNSTQYECREDLVAANVISVVIYFQ
jgi:hypothetical protein